MSPPATWFSEAERSASAAYHRPLHAMAALVAGTDFVVGLALWWVVGTQAVPGSPWSLVATGAVLASCRSVHRRLAEGWRELVHERRRATGSTPVLPVASVVTTMVLRSASEIAAGAASFALVGTVAGWMVPVAVVVGATAGAALLVAAVAGRRIGPALLDRAVPLRPSDDRHGLLPLVHRLDDEPRPTVLVGRGRLVASGQCAYASGTAARPLIVVDPTVLDGDADHGTLARTLVIHELGHHRLGHLRLGPGAFTAAAAVALSFPAVAVWLPPSPRAVIAADLGFRVLGLPVAPLFAGRSRRLELEADRWAAARVGDLETASSMARWSVASGVELEPAGRAARTARYPPPGRRLDVLAGARRPGSDVAAVSAP